MIDLGKAKVFKGQVAETGEGGSDGTAPVAHIFQELLELVSVHLSELIAYVEKDRTRIS